MSDMVQLWIRAVVCGAVFLASPWAQAQQDQTPEKKPEDRKGIESITITARKVEQDLQSTAEAVTAFSGADLESRGIDEVKNIGRLTPNVRFENVPGTGVTATVTIRGISQADLLITGDPSVGIYTDGVYNARLVGGNFSFFDVERVEVLKGPQGTLYGKNTPAGAINIWSRRPSPELGGYLRGTYGSDQRQDVEGAVSFPILGEELSGRIAFLSRDDDGYITNHAAAPLGTFGGTSGVNGGVGDQNGQGARFSLLWDPSDEVEVWAQGYRYREHRHGGYPHQVSYVNDTLITSPVISAAAFDEAAWAAYNAAADADDIYTSFRGRQDIETLGGSFTASYDFGEAELKYRGGYREYQFLSATDLDGSPFSLADIGRPDQPQDEKSRQASHELTLTGTTLEKLSYTGGFYLFDERSSNNATQFFDTAFGGAGFRTYGDLSSFITSWALYTQGSYALTERLDLVLGLRHTEEHRKINRNTASCIGLACAPSPAFAGSIPHGTDFSDDWNALTWLASLEFQATDDMFLYAKASTGYRSGGFNGRGATIAALAIPFDEEFVTSYEVGAKADWFDSLLRTNLALFYLKYKDRQTTELRNTISGIASVIVNSGNADVSGGELEIWAEPIDALKLGGSMGWNWFRFADNSNEPVNAPAFTYYLWGDYSLPSFDFGQLSARLELQYQSQNFTTSTPSAGAPRLVAPAFGLVNGRIGLELPAINSEIALLGTNLLNREYYAAGVDFVPSGFGFQTRYYAPGRRVAFELTYRFGADAN